MEFDKVLVKVHGYVPSLLNTDIKTIRHLRATGRALLARHKHVKKQWYIFQLIKALIWFGGLKAQTCYFRSMSLMHCVRQVSGDLVSLGCRSRYLESESTRNNLIHHRLYFYECWGDGTHWFKVSWGQLTRYFAFWSRSNEAIHSYSDLVLRARCLWDKK